MYCIYRVTNNLNGKTYIGQHQYIDEKDPMGKYSGSGKALKQAYKKYGKENFSIEVLYKRIRDRETANVMEVWMIAKERKENINGCYNMADGGEGHGGPWRKGKLASDETRQRMSAANKGKKITEEQKRKISATLKGRPLPESVKQKVSETMKKYKWYNNGIMHIRAVCCPEGFVPGMLKKEKRK